MSSLKVSRQDKNQMRKQLEEILSIRKALDQKINDYRQESIIEEYREFWQDMEKNNKEDIQKLSHFMVRKCNR